MTFVSAAGDKRPSVWQGVCIQNRTAGGSTHQLLDTFFCDPDEATSG
jgi:hypothetical protein